MNIRNKWLLPASLVFMIIMIVSCIPRSSAPKVQTPVEQTIPAPEEIILPELETLALLDLYAGIPDYQFPIPMIDGTIIPYDRFFPPEEWDIVTTYLFDGVSLMESYQAQLRESGFIDNGSVEWIESLWRFDREEDGASLTVEMFHEDDSFIIVMYVNYLGED